MWICLQCFCFYTKLFAGLVDVALQVNGEGGLLQPFPPGTFEEYDIAEDGRTTLVRKQSYYTPGDRPAFKPFIPYEGNF